MKTLEDEAFDELATRQGDWGSGFQTKPWNEDEWRRNNWRCGHGWLRGEQCEICNAAQKPVECLDCGSHNIGIPATYDSLVNSVKEQPAPEPVAWADLLKEAQQIVESKFLWKKFIDGTPLANDIACWMADFAQQYTTPPQSAQEPVAWWNFNSGFSHCMIDQLNEAAKKNPAPVYTTPPQREWVGLTDGDKSELAKAQHSWEDLCLAVEAKLKERNHGT